MSLLTRFRKSGGFLQLVQLVETTEPRRREELLVMIAKEDPGWAQILRLKVLSLERILSWKETVLSYIWPQVPIPLIVILWQKSNTANREKIEKSMPFSYRGPFRAALSSIQAVDDAEFTAASLRMISLVRDMSIHGLIKFKDFDPALDWDPKLVEEDPFKSA